MAELDEPYIARMEDVLAGHEKALSAWEPMVCIDEKPVVLHEEVRLPMAMRPGQVGRRDAEYKTLRNGQRFLLVLVGKITSTPDDRRDVQFIALLGADCYGEFLPVLRFRPAFSSGESVKERMLWRHLA